MRGARTKLNKTSASPKESIEPFKRQEESWVRVTEGSFDSQGSASAELSQCLKAPEKCNRIKLRSYVHQEQKIQSQKHSDFHTIPLKQIETKMQSRSTLSNPSVTPPHKIKIFDRTRTSNGQETLQIQTCKNQNLNSRMDLNQIDNLIDQRNLFQLSGSRLLEANNIYGGHNGSYQCRSPRDSSIYNSEISTHNLKRKQCNTSSTSIDAPRTVEHSFAVKKPQKGTFQGSSENLHSFQIPKSARDHITIHESGQPDVENSDPATKPRFQSSFAFQKKVAQKAIERIQSTSPAPLIPADRPNFKLEIENSSLRFRINQLETHSKKQAESRDF